MKKYYFLLFLFFLGLIISGIHPRNYGHWIAEIAPTIIGLVILVVTFKKFRFTFFTYSIILGSCFLMFVGAHYSFSRVPMFDWVKDFLGQDRNNFDRVGHFVQGIVPVLIARELFLRRKLVTGYRLISVISFSICLAITSGYELIEYIAFIIFGNDSSAFLGTQGDIWDSHMDMMAAVLGGLVVLFFLRKFHDRIIEKEFPGTF